MSCTGRAVSVYGSKIIIERSRSGNRGQDVVEVRKYPLLVFPAFSSFRRPWELITPFPALLHHLAISACTEGSIRPAQVESSAGHKRIAVRFGLLGVALCLAFRSEFRGDP